MGADRGSVGQIPCACGSAMPGHPGVPCPGAAWVEDDGTVWLATATDGARYMIYLDPNGLAALARQVRAALLTKAGMD